MQIFIKNTQFTLGHVIGFALILLLASCAFPANANDQCTGQGLSKAVLAQ